MCSKRLTKRRTSKDELEFNFTFEQAFDYFLSAKKFEGLRQTTIKSHLEHYNFFIKWLNEMHPEIKMVADLTSFTVREYIIYMQDDHYNYKTKTNGLSVQTVNARLRFLKTFYNFLDDENLIKDNSIEKIKLLKSDERKFTKLTDDELKRLFEIPNKENFPQFRDFVIMNLLYDTGMRISETISIKKTDLDFKSRKIILPSDVTKGRKERIIPVSNYTLKLLIELIAENDAHWDNRYVFLNWNGEQMSDDTFRRNLKRYVSKAGIEKDFSCHDFRRQAVTDMLANGASIWAVQAIVGHVNILPTKRSRDMQQTVNLVQILPAEPAENEKGGQAPSGNGEQEVNISLKTSTNINTNTYQPAAPTSFYGRFKHFVSSTIGGGQSLISRLFGVYKAHSTPLTKYGAFADVEHAGYEALRAAVMATKAKRIKNLPGFYSGVLDCVLDRFVFEES
ncbi:tyrosine-type recombinase/integrase [Domibacillus tundrae]|uniref:tyrosine-type recombinase/integrase n=1 Tax=Domibacillus tundrae TaxID=1587527 RepID=UPI00061834BF|nr:tyrosine-type recombinase/integrase [Domibacillus tundrae]